MIPSNPLLSISTEGWCEGVARAPCDNFDPRPEGADISLLVIHNISLPPGQFGSTHIEALFANTLDCDAHPYFAQLRGLKVSSHFLIRRDGTALQFVPTTQRAWHSKVVSAVMISLLASNSKAVTISISPTRNTAHWRG